VEGASVLLDGSEVEQTDANGQAYILGVSPGSHVVSVDKDGYQRAERNISVYYGLTKSISITLSPEEQEATGALIIDSTPGNAFVLLDGSSVGKTDADGNAYFADIGAGNHRVMLRKDGYQSASETITFDGSGLDQTVQIRLQPESSDAGAINTDEESAGDAETSSPDTSEPEREEESSDGGASNPLDRSGEAPQNPSQATLEIDANVGGANVYLNGSYRGRTTSQGSAEIAISPGQYRVTLAKRGFVDQERITQLESGNTRTIQFILERAGPGRQSGSDLPLILALLLVGAIGIVAVVLVVLVKQDDGKQEPVASTSEVSGTFDRYRLQRMLGRGGMATVYLAEDTVEERQVALKILDSSHLNDQDLVRKFLGEGEALKRINESHPEAPVQLDHAGGGGGGTTP